MTSLRLASAWRRLCLDCERCFFLSFLECLRERFLPDRPRSFWLRFSFLSRFSFLCFFSPIVSGKHRLPRWNNVVIACCCACVCVQVCGGGRLCLSFHHINFCG